MANKAAFKQVCAELEEGRDLTFEMLGRVFGADFWMLLVYGFLDAQDAARAIQGAIARLSAGEAANG